MSSWRDGTSAEAQHELDELMVAVLQVAEHLLDSQGGFVPFGGFMELDGSVHLAASDPGEGEQPPADAAIQVLLDGFRGSRDTIGAMAIATDVLIDRSDAVRIELEHRDGMAIQVLMPYRLKRVSGGLERGDLIAEPGRRRIWDEEPQESGSSG